MGMSTGMIMSMGMSMSMGMIMSMGMSMSTGMIMSMGIRRRKLDENDTKKSCKIFKFWAVMV